MHTPKLPEGYNTVNPFIITKDAPELIDFLKEVFSAEEDMAAHTMDTDGLLLHAELTIGNSRIMVADTKPGWPRTPSLAQVYVDDLDETLKKAEKLGAHIVTQSTDFFGDLFSRFIDPFGNLWWVYQHNEQAAQSWSEADDSDNSSSDATWEPTKEMKYLHETLLEAMVLLGNKK